MSTEEHDQTAHEQPKPAEQAKEAARDDPDRQELTNMVYGMGHVVELLVDGEDDEWRPTTITVGFDDSHHGRADVIEVMQIAGWKVSDVTFAYNRIAFRERGA